MTPTAYSWAGLAVAGLAVAGSLFLSLGMKLAACPLCYYQRTCVMGAFAVLLVGVVGGVETRVNLPGLALPLALAGLALAGWHVRLELAGRMECPGGILGLGTAPQQSLAAMGLVSAVLLAGTFQLDLPGSGPLQALTSAGLALVLAAGCVASASPPPKPDPKSYDQPPTTCRPMPRPPG